MFQAVYDNAASQLLSRAAGTGQVHEFTYLFASLVGERLGLDALALAWSSPAQPGTQAVSWKKGRGTAGPEPVALTVSADSAHQHPAVAAWLGVEIVQQLPLEIDSQVCGLLILGGKRGWAVSPEGQTLLSQFQGISRAFLANWYKTVELEQSIHRVRKPRSLSRRRRVDHQLRLIAENAPDLILQVNRPGVIIFANRSEVGFNAEEAVGTSVFDWLPPEHHAEARAAIDRVFATRQKQEHEFHWHNGSGLVRWFAARLSPIIPDSSDQVHSTVIILTDITERKQTEEALQRYKLLAENACEMIYFIRVSDGQIMDANLAAIKTCGYSHAELTALTVWDLRAPAERDKVRPELEQGYSCGITFETIHLRKNGEEFPAEVSSQGVDLNGQRVVMSIVRDITGRQRARERLHKQIAENLQLLEEARRRTQELETLALISSALRQAHTRAEIIPLLVQTTTEALDAQAAGLLLLEDNQLLFAAGSGSLEPLAGARVPQDCSALWEVIRTGEPRFIRPPQSSDRPVCTDFFRTLTSGFGGVSIVPIKTSETTIGILCAGYSSPQNPLSEHLSLAHAFAEIAGNGLQRILIRERLERLVANRTKELEAVYNITSVASESLDLTEALQRGLEQTLVATRCIVGAVFLLDESETQVNMVAQLGIPPDVQARIEQLPFAGSLEGWVIEHNEPLLLPDLAADPRSGWAIHPEVVFSFVGVPMRVQGRVVGVLSITGPAGNPFSIDELALLSFIADHLGLIVENFRLHQRAEQAAVIEERSRLARELHDSVTQSLYSVALFANAGKALAQKGECEQTYHSMVRIGEISQQALKEMRLLVYELRPTVLDQDGLIGALQQRLDAVESRSGIRARLHALQLPPLPLRLEETLYRIALEALNNALKHARAADVTVSVQVDSGWVRLTVQDNGCGFDLARAEDRGGLGLVSMRERAEKLGGKLEVTTGPGTGTTVAAHVPVDMGASRS